MNCLYLKVQPRVLSKEQVAAMATTLDGWIGSIVSMENLIEAKAAEILTN